MEPLYLFIKDIPSVSIFELKSNGVPNNAPKNLKYQWFLLRDRKMTALTFTEQLVANGILIRKFEEGVLAWDDVTGKAEFYLKETDETIHGLEKTMVV